MFASRRAGFPITFLIPVLLLCSFFTLAGCMGMKEGARKGDLNFAVNDYIQSLRWGLLARALVYIPDDQKDHFIKTAENVFDKVSFADFEIRAILPDQEITTAKVMLNVGIYTKDSLRLVTVKKVQHWKKVEKHWYIMDPDLEVYLRKLGLDSNE